MTLHTVNEARHNFSASNDSRAAGSCVRCGRREVDSVHNVLAYHAAVQAHLGMAVNAARAGDMDEVIRQAGTAVRLAQEGI